VISVDHDAEIFLSCSLNENITYICVSVILKICTVVKEKFITS